MAIQTKSRFFAALRMTTSLTYTVMMKTAWLRSENAVHFETKTGKQAALKGLRCGEAAGNLQALFSFVSFWAPAVEFDGLGLRVHDPILLDPESGIDPHLPPQVF